MVSKFIFNFETESSNVMFLNYVGQVSGRYGFIALLVFCFHMPFHYYLDFSKVTVNCQYYSEILGCTARFGGSTQLVISQVKVNFTITKDNVPESPITWW